MSARVLRAEQRDAGIIRREVRDARAQAAAILDRAEQDAARLREQAIEEGRAAGLAQTAEQAAHELLAIADARQRALDSLQPQAIEIALAAARQILGQELTTRPELAAQLVAPLLQRVRRAQRITLRVHPSDAPAIGQLLERVVGAELQLHVDPALERGDCVLESDIGALDARISVRLAAIAKALRER